MTNAQSQTQSSEILLPSAVELDSSDRMRDWTVVLYLIPAEESQSGLPEVTSFTRIGSGTPAMAYHNRWACVGRLPRNAVGDSVLEALEGCRSKLLALAACYRGTEWDGRNHRGTWSDDAEGATEDLDLEWSRQTSELQRYWDAGDYYGAAVSDWVDLCRQAGIDPDRARGDGWRVAAREVAAAVDAQHDDHVAGTEEYALGLAAEYRDDIESGGCECGE